MEIKIASALDKVFPDIAPTLIIDKCSMLKNERYHLQLCIYNDSEWPERETKITVMGDISKYCQFRVVENIPAQITHYVTDDDYYIFNENKSGLYPDLLRPLEYGDVILPPKQWRAIWCTIHCPQGLSAGKHELTFTLTCPNGKVLKSEFIIDVVDAFLPESDLLYTNWMHYDGIAQYYHVKPLSKKFYKLLGSFIDTAVLHGVNIIYTPIFTPALDTKIGWQRIDVQLVSVVERDKNVYEFDFSKLEKFVDFSLARGIKYFEMSHLATQWGAKACPKIMAKTNNGYKRIFGWDTDSYGDKYKLFLAQFLPALDKFLKQKGIAKNTFFHISDEPTEQQFPEYKKVADYIKGYIKDYKVIDATSTMSNDIVDIPILSTTHIPEGIKGEVWAYYCSSACDNYLSNRFFNMPSQRNRILGIQLYEQNKNGFLHWGFNFYNTAFSYRPINPFLVSDSACVFPAGDSYVVYPGTKGAWDSLRLEVFYDGLQDRMALKLLEKYIGREKVLELLHAEGVKGWKTYPRDGAWHIAFREKLNREIQESIF